VSGRNARLASIVLFVLAVISARVHADNISLPLAGYFHPGRAMPVKWDAAGWGAAPGSLELSAPGAITTQINWTGNPRGIVPWIAVDASVANIHWRSPTGEARDISRLRPLEDSDWLVGTTLPDDFDTSSLFPNRRSIRVRLDPEDLKSPPMAWQTLDALILTPSEIAKISISNSSELIAQGVELVVQGGNRPDPQLPWKHSGQWWVASLGRNLPPTINSDAYRPTDGWSAGRSEPFRRRIFLLGAIYTLVIGGVALWRSHWMSAAFILVSIIAAGVFALDNQRASPIFQRTGTVCVDDSASFKDDWIFQVSHRPAKFQIPVTYFIHPIFADQSQAESSTLQLECNGDGEPKALTGQLSPDEPLALMKRRLTLDYHKSFITYPVTSPLQLLVRESIYPQLSIADQAATADPIRENEWPMIVLKRQ
jgi:hypothetical protein